MFSRAHSIKMSEQVQAHWLLADETLPSDVELFGAAGRGWACEDGVPQSALVHDLVIDEMRRDLSTSIAQVRAGTHPMFTPPSSPTKQLNFYSPSKLPLSEAQMRIVNSVFDVPDGLG
jgi:hypothetical protein